MFQAAVTDAVGHIVKQTSDQPPKYLVKLLFSFRGVTEVEVPASAFTQTNSFALAFPDQEQIVKPLGY